MHLRQSLSYSMVPTGITPLLLQKERRALSHHQGFRRQQPSRERVFLLIVDFCQRVSVRDCRNSLSDMVRRQGLRSSISGRYCKGGIIGICRVLSITASGRNSHHLGVEASGAAKYSCGVKKRRTGRSPGPQVLRSCWVLSLQR